MNYRRKGRHPILAGEGVSAEEMRCGAYYDRGN
ncbi:hypothetical protein HNQ56_000582 [Anaerotaenia torta]